MSKILVLVGTHKGAFFFTSDAARERWHIEGPILKGWEVSDLYLDTRGETRLFAAVGHFVWGTQIQVSSDLGSHWRPVEKGPAFAVGSELQLNRVWCISPGGAGAPETLYAGVDEAAVFVSRDRGRSWQELEGLSRHPTREDWIVSHGGLCCHTLLADPFREGRLWAGISAAGVLRSDDEGRTWEVKNSGLPPTAPSERWPELANCVHSMVVSHQEPDVLYQQNHGGIFRSTDAGGSWQRIENGLDGKFGLPMAARPADNRNLFISPVMESQEIHTPTNGKLAVYRSLDGGDHWERKGDGLPENHYYGFVLRQAMAVDTLEPAGVYFGTTGGQVFYSREAGEQWQLLPGFDLLPRVLCVRAVELE